MLEMKTNFSAHPKNSNVQNVLICLCQSLTTSVYTLSDILPSFQFQTAVDLVVEDIRPNLILVLFSSFLFFFLVAEYFWFSNATMHRNSMFVTEKSPASLSEMVAGN